MRPDRRTVLVRETSPEGLVTDVHEVVGFALRRGLDPARETLVKINGNFNIPYPGSNTSRWFLDALFGALRSHGFGRLTTIEGDLPEFKAADMIRTTGLQEVLERHGVGFLPLEGLPRDSREIPLRLGEAQLLNVPVLHTHAQAVISCATKNLFGVLPWDRRKYHGELEDKLLELTSRIPCFTIVDGTVGLEGESTRRGTPVRCDLILAGSDPLAVDLVAAREMGFVPDEIPLLRLALHRGVVEAPPAVEGRARGTSPRRFELKLSLVRKLTNAINRTPLVRFGPLWTASDLLRVRLHRLNHRVKRRGLAAGPWMEYDRCFEARVSVDRAAAAKTREGA